MDSDQTNLQYQYPLFIYLIVLKQVNKAFWLVFGCHISMVLIIKNLNHKCPVLIYILVCLRYQLRMHFLNLYGATVTSNWLCFIDFKILFHIDYFVSFISANEVSVKSHIGAPPFQSYSFKSAILLNRFQCAKYIL